VVLQQSSLIPTSNPHLNQKQTFCPNKARNNEVLVELQNISSNYREEIGKKSEEKEREAANQLELANALETQTARCEEVNCELGSQKLRQASLKEEVQKSSLQMETLETELRMMIEGNPKLQQRSDEAEEKASTIQSEIFQLESLRQSEVKDDAVSHSHSHNSHPHNPNPQAQQ